MNVCKKDGSLEPFDRSKLLKRLEKLSYGLDVEFLSLSKVVDRVENGIFDGVSTEDLDQLLAETCADLTTVHYDYGNLAGRVAVSHLQKSVGLSFDQVIYELSHLDEEIDQSKKDGYESSEEDREASEGLLPKPLIDERLNQLVQKNKDRINAEIRPERDMDFSFFGFKTLEKSYLLRKNGKILETPQYLLMRVAIGIHMDDLDAAIETYHLMSQKYFIHATPTLFNSGTIYPQLSSCFLVAMSDDSIRGIYKTLGDCALISKYAGGIGLHVHNIRAAGSFIRGTNGTSNGLVPMLRVFNNTARYVDQGGNKRPGAFAIYLEPWHGDIVEFLDLRKNHGKEEMRARDLFYALWIPDLFMKKVEKNEDWHLFSPSDVPRLADAYGDKFEALYNKYVAAGKFQRVVKAQKLWHSILEAQVETGGPFMLYKDACNEKSNQKNLGTIKSSNLCCEVVQYSSPTETAVCNLCSVALPSFVSESKREAKTEPETETEEEVVTFDFEKLYQVTKTVTKNLNRIIDISFYPVKEAEVSNRRNRPIAIGVQGLADTFMKLGLPYDSPEARSLNKRIFETIYFAAVEQSVELAAKYGPYDSYEGSPASKQELQFDLWGLKEPEMWDWKSLKQKLSKYGMRNSLLTALMPTASTSQILGFNECMEPYTSNFYSRRVLSGEYQVVNQYLMKDLIRLGLWSESIKTEILRQNGSIQKIDGIPDPVKHLYRTVWEMSQKSIIDMAADRGPFIDQSQSMNIFMAEPTMRKLTSMHFYGWKKGLKTGMYYLRTEAAARPIQFTVAQKPQEAELTGGNTDPKAKGNALEKYEMLARKRKYIAAGEIHSIRTKLKKSDALPADQESADSSETTTPLSTSCGPSVSETETGTPETTEEYDVLSDTPLYCSRDKPYSCTSCSG